ncbi:putative ABC-type sugar transport system,periplasmic component [Vibrio nigripulchritudo SFn27]|uniref:ABC-type sugar transport system,periplasmic component n=2 Tax=Vibrio nigripulchritudo TaxID=28173 RepID=A0AAV2VWE6_9VIBR|nr:ABC transporter substrate-binding protein [Vibrio nigripulchritudo]CCN80727.1 putative ABC-type sugar transport system,periplasmic component [Vibrio nigripulchritudo BLFn1]CCN87861.1 putative ABC-type sugar transport system,periplasmic component [Vibrio nigripulchritudo SFn27]CCN93710.1 putative ABC-type sugar transport system,periplasmic component [Vibrio nigripulchritudo ENn2]CCO43081.1 putative ABC-type sugar transport system,periplasmic component [Vibrio nigripulchritudo SFn135]CCO49063
MKAIKRALGLSILASSSLAYAADKTELTMYYPVAVGGALTQVVDGMVDDFEKQNPDISVTAIYAGNYDDTRVKALAALKAGEPVQTSVLFSIDLLELKRMGVIRPFDDFAKTSEDKAWLNSFYPALMENGQHEGKTYGIPFQRSTIVMYYNKDAYRAAGLDPESPPTTWKALRETAAKLVKKDGSGKVTQWGMMIPSTGYPYWMFGALTKQQGQTLMSSDGKTVNFNSPKVVEALEFWKDLGTKDQVMPKGTIEWGTLRQEFLEGNTAMMWHSTGNLTAVLKNAKFDVGVAQLPANAELGSPTGGGNFYLLNSGTDSEQKAAYKLVKFMSSPERSAQWSIATGYVGVSEAAYQTEALKTHAQKVPQAVVARDQLKHATAELATYEAGRVRKALDDAIQATLTGQSSAQQALDKAQKQAERLLKRATRS